MMTMERLKQLLDAFGAKPERWPDAERAAASALIEGSPEAQRLLRDAAALDRLLDEAETAPVTRALEDRILAGLPERMAPSGGVAAKASRAWSSRHWLPASALAASLVLGLAAGAVLPGLIGLTDPQSIDQALLAFGDVDADLWGETGDGS